MQYLLCPRCHFRAPSNKHICTTCGFILPSASNPKPLAQEARVTATKTQQNGWFQQFFGMNGQQEEVAKEAAAEEPALG